MNAIVWKRNKKKNLWLVPISPFFSSQDHFISVDDNFSILVVLLANAIIFNVHLDWSGHF